MKRKTDSKNGMKIQELRAKALRRADKLANTLRKLVAKGDPNDSSVAPLLKELGKTLPRLRQLADQKDGIPVVQQETGPVERASGKTKQALVAPPRSRSRKAKREPAPAPAVVE